MTLKFSHSIRGVCVAVLVAAALLVQSRQALGLGTTKPLKQYGRQSWQSDTGLPQNTVHAIVQTKDGYIWMATEGGLVRFDGQELRTFDSSNTNELPSNSVNDLSVDAEGALWISTPGGLVRREGDRFTLMGTSDGLPSNMVRFTRVRSGGGLLVVTAGGVAAGGVATGVREVFHPLAGVSAEIAPELVADDNAGTMWIASGQQMFSLAVGANSVTAIDVAEVGEIQAIAAGAQGEMWIGGRNGLAVLHKGGKVSSVAGVKMGITALLAMPDGGFWIGAEAGLFRYAHGVLQRVDEKNSVTSGRVIRLFADREGGVWVAYDLGVTRAAAGDPEHLQEPLDIGGTLSIFEDREGDMWFGTDVGGATILREQAFSTLTTQDGLSDDFVRAVFQDHAGTIWVGTNRGGLNRMAQGKVSALRAGKGGLSSNVVLALAEADGDLWIGTPDGLSRMHDGQLKLFTTADGLPDDFVRSLYADTDGSLWIGTRNGLSHYAHGGFTSYSRLDGLGGDLIGSILRTRDGALWVGTINGLSRFDGKSFHSLSSTCGNFMNAIEASNPITTMAEDHEGTLWIASHEAGLTRMRPDKLGRELAYTVGDMVPGLPREIYSIVEANDAKDPLHTSLWLGSSKGVFRVSLDGLNAVLDNKSKSVEVQSFSVADGMKISECSSGGHPAAWRMSDGTLWFATLRGAATIRPGAGYENRIAPLMAIEDVLIDDQPARTEPALTIQPGHDRISIHYAGLSFRAPQKLRFRYKLEGFDHDWIDAGARRTAFYTNLPAASYRFIVVASAGDGVWSAIPGEIRFTIRPHFYRTIWFYCLGLVLAALLAWLVYRSRVKIVEAQYQAVLAERTRIAREIHDTLAQGYVGISVQLEVASRLLQSSKEAAAQQLENTKEYVRSSLADARSSIWNLRSPGAESETLPARLAAAVKSRQQSGSDAPILRFDVHGSYRPVNRRVEDELLRIGQEAVSNALRHAAANSITVALSYATDGDTAADTDRLNLTVCDDGNGFDPAAIATGHYGVQGMRERAGTIGAALVIESRTGAGTTVKVTYRLEKDSDRKEVE